MNKTEWGNGFHVTPSAMEFLQDEFTNGFKQLLSTDLTSSFIISGCSVVDDVRQDGVIVIDGEIMPFKANGTSTDYIKVSYTVEQNVYKNNESVDAYYTRYAECTPSDDSSVKAKFSEIRTFRMSARYADVEWTGLTFAEGYESTEESWWKYGYPRGIGSAQYSVCNNSILFRGGIKTTIENGFDAGNVLATIGIKPLHEVKIPVVGYVSSDSSTSNTDLRLNCVITLNTDGTLTFKKEDFGALGSGYSCRLFERVLFNYIPTRID